jgi:hypothetical protein
MKRLLVSMLVLASCVPMQIDAMRRGKKTDPKSLVAKAEELKEYAKLSADELRARSDEVSALIAELKGARDSDRVVLNGKDWKKINDAVNEYKKAEQKTLKAAM